MRGQEHVLIWGRCIFVTVEVRMRVAILTVILVGFFGSAAAKWVEVAGNESSTVYADSDTIRKTGDTVKIWTLVDYKAVVRIDSTESRKGSGLSLSHVIWYLPFHHGQTTKTRTQRRAVPRHLPGRRARGHISYRPRSSCLA